MHKGRCWCFTIGDARLARNAGDRISTCGNWFGHQLFAFYVCISTVASFSPRVDTDATIASVSRAGRSRTDPGLTNFSAKMCS